MYRRCVCTFKYELNALFVFVTSGDPVCFQAGAERIRLSRLHRDFRSLFTSISVSSLRRIGQQMYAKGRRYTVSAVICIAISNIDYVIRNTTTSSLQRKIFRFVSSRSYVGSNYCYVTNVRLYRIQIRKLGSKPIDDCVS